MDSDRTKRICVVGGGVAGLVSAKVFARDGFEVVLFEKAPTIGGVWAASRTYPGLRTNGPRETYAYSDFPYPPTADEFPTAEQVRAYLESYVDHFDLHGLIRLSTEVVSISRRPTGGQPRFQVVVRPADGRGTPETHHFDFVAICNGVFSTPYLPSIEGRERFAGRVLHSSQVAEHASAEGQRVLVVGAGKSALDCATWTAPRARSCTLVFRTPHWMMPRYFFGLIRMDRLLMTRVSELLLRYHRMSRLEAVLHGPGRPIVRLFWRGQSRLIARLLKLPPVLVPDAPLPLGFERSGVGDEFYSVLRQHQVATKRGSIVAFTDKTTVALDTGEHIAADVVIFATGWRRDLAFLDADLRTTIFEHGTFQLYRQILPPDEHQLGFIGYASSIACPFTSELGAHWLSQCFRGELDLPTSAAMEHEIAAVRRWSAAVFPACPEGYLIGPYVAHYVDDLMRDMRLRTARTSNPLTEYFARFGPDRYRAVGEERRRARRLGRNEQHSP